MPQNTATAPTFVFKLGLLASSYTGLGFLEPTDILAVLTCVLVLTSFVTVSAISMSRLHGSHAAPRAVRACGGFTLSSNRIGRMVLNR